GLLRAAAARGDGRARVGERGEFRGRIAGVSALHKARELDRARWKRAARAGGSGLGPSRQGRELAERPAGRDYASAAARSVGAALGEDERREVTKGWMR